MNLRFLPQAKAELREAVAYYNEQRPGLGDELRAEVELATDQIKSFPRASPKLSANLRRRRLKRFPYGLVYEATSEEIVIMAVMHLHRRPGYWRDRV
jgi:plasmid stabilization system protein ParE